LIPPPARGLKIFSPVVNPRGIGDNRKKGARPESKSVNWRANLALNVALIVAHLRGASL
jgi:hypothetical protein